MQTISNAVQDRVLGAHPIAKEANPEYVHRPDGSTMRALAWYGTKDVRVVDAAIPDITEDLDVILKVTGTTICGSDMHLYNSEIMTLQKGDILGHEFMGIVDKVGPGVKNIKPGDRVVTSFQIACGTCEYCKKKLSSFCDRTNNSSLMNALYGHRDAGFMGYSHLAGGFPGGQAEYVRVPFGNVNCLKVPAELSDEQVLYLSDVLPTSYHNVVDTGVKEGDVVAIWGLGPIGQCSAKWAKIKGASKVIGIDRVPSRLKFALANGCDEVINFAEHTDVVKRLNEISPGGIDVGLDCGTFHEPKTVLHKVQKTLMLETDVPETLNEMLLATKKGGRIGLIAVYSGFTNSFNIGALMEKGIRFIGNGQAPVHLYWEEILNDYILTGKFDPRFMISHRVDLEDFPLLYEKFNKRIAGVEKVFVQTKFSSPPGPGCPPLTHVADWPETQDV